MWVQGRITKKRVAARPGNTWPEEWSNMSTSCQRKATKKRFEEKRDLDAAREPRGIYCILDDDPDCGEFMSQPERFKLVRLSASGWSQMEKTDMVLEADQHKDRCQK